MTQTVGIGYWIQVSSYPVVTLARTVGNQATVVHATVGAVGHVLDVEPDGWLIAWFERTGHTSSVGPDNYLVLGGPDTGK